MKITFFLLSIVYTCFSLELAEPCSCSGQSECSTICGNGLQCMFINTTETYRECLDCSLCNDNLVKCDVFDPPCTCKGRGSTCNEGDGDNCCEGFRCTQVEDFHNLPGVQHVCRASPTNVPTNQELFACGATGGLTCPVGFAKADKTQCEAFVTAGERCPGAASSLWRTNCASGSSTSWCISRPHGCFQDNNGGVWYNEIPSDPGTAHGNVSPVCYTINVEGPSTTSAPTRAPTTNSSESQITNSGGEDNSDSTIIIIIATVSGAILCCCIIIGAIFFRGKSVSDNRKVDKTISEPVFIPSAKGNPDDYTSEGSIDSELESALNIVKVFCDAKLKIIRQIQRAQRIEGVPGKERTYKESIYQIERQQEKMIRMLEEKYQDKKRIQRFKPHIERIWEDARQGKLIPQQNFTTRPSMQARSFFQFFDYENHGTMSLMEFAPVAKLVDPSLQMDNINLLFDFMKGDAADMFENWHVEDFFASDWEGGLEKFKLDLIRYMSSHSPEQARDGLSQFYASNKRSAQPTVSASHWSQEIEMSHMAGKRTPSAFQDPIILIAADNSPNVRTYNAISMGVESLATSISSENTHMSADISPQRPHLKPKRPPRPPHRTNLIRTDSGETVSTYNPDRHLRLSQESMMTTSTVSTLNNFVKNASNDDFRAGLNVFELDEEKTLTDLYADIERMESQESAQY